MTLSRNYYAMPTEHGDGKSAETDIATLSVTDSGHYQRGQLLQARAAAYAKVRPNERLGRKSDT